LISITFIGENNQRVAAGAQDRHPILLLHLTIQAKRKTQRKLSKSQYRKTITQVTIINIEMFTLTFRE
jgi:hypothetical protein